MSSTATATRSARVGIIGSGFGGIAAAVRLIQTGEHDFLILERGAELGGTWRDNHYPGCACDVPSNLYSYSFAPNPDWTTTFAHQEEIRQYTHRVAERFGLPAKIHTGTRVDDAAWNAQTQRWEVDTSRGRYEFDVLVPATGPLSVPAYPDVPGLDDFAGPVFHSAEWRHDIDLTGKRVAVIGTGASAIQFVPQLQQVVGELKLFQRTPPWVMPRPEYRTSPLRRMLFRRIPLLQRVARLSLYWTHELTVIGLTRRPAIMRLASKVALRHLSRAVKDPELRGKLTPDFTLGCKRILLSNDYYPAVAAANVEVIAAGVSEIREGRVVAANGEEREIDAIVLGTGFHVTDLPIAEHVRGADGRTLAEVWGGSMRAYRGATVPGFPNLFFMLGPNTGLGHSSMIFMAEAQANYVADAVRRLREHDLAHVDVRPERWERWNAGIQRRMRRTVWIKGGCASWYLDEHGRNTTLWPDFTFTFRRLTRQFDLESYSTLPRRAATEGRTAAAEPVA